MQKGLLQQIKSLFLNILWEGKKKLSLRVPQGNKEAGGLGLVNLETRNKAFKIQCVAKINKSNDYLLWYPASY